MNKGFKSCLVFLNQIASMIFYRNYIAFVVYFCFNVVPNFHNCTVYYLNDF